MLEAHALTKVHHLGGVAVTALSGVDISITPGEFVAVTGPSGAGKSTLLHVLGGLEKPTSGAVVWEGRDLGGLSDRRLTELRRSHYGFVFQNFNLVPSLNAQENVEAAMVGTGMSRRGRRERAKGLLATVGLAERAAHLPDQLSGGEQQRVAIARALANQPSVVFADEPTGNLDSETGIRIVTALRQLHHERMLTVVMVTHDMGLAAYAQRIVRMRDGSLVSTSEKVATSTRPTVLASNRAG